MTFKLDGALIQTENVFPYDVHADNGTNPIPWHPVVGPHLLTATPYSAANGSGIAGPAINVSFTAY